MSTNLQRRSDDLIITYLKAMEARIMAALDDVTATIKAAAAQLGTDLASEIADLKASGQAPTAAQLQALTDIATQLQGLDTTVKAADPGPATPPAA